MTPRAKQTVKLTIRILVTVGLLIWVFSQIDLRNFIEAAKTARWRYLIAVWAFTVLYFSIESMEMRLILRKQLCNVSIKTLFGASAVTSLYGMFLPGILSTGVKWYILRQDTGKGTNVLSSMLYSQLVLLVVMTVVGLTALIVTNPAPLLLQDTKNTHLLPVVAGILLMATLAGGILLLNARTGRRITRSVGYLLRPLSERIRQKGDQILTQIEVFQTAGVWFHLKIALLALTATMVACVCMYDSAARAANITVPPGVFIWLCALVFALGRIPISVANLGVREVTVVSLLAFYGVEKSAALLMSMILFSAQVFMAHIGAVYQLSWALGAKGFTRPSGASVQPPKQPEQ